MNFSTKHKPHGYRDRLRSQMVYLSVFRLLLPTLHKDVFCVSGEVVLYIQKKVEDQWLDSDWVADGSGAWNSADTIPNTTDL
jgi:hypothetical protein